MAVTFTKEQSMAIELHGRNILVSAAAGSGKTAVLVERIVRMVCDERNPVDIDRLLVVTFTNAAAAEMRERIAAGISKRLAGNPRRSSVSPHFCTMPRSLPSTASACSCCGTILTKSAWILLSALPMRGKCG